MLRSAPGALRYTSSLAATLLLRVSSAPVGGWGRSRVAGIIIRNCPFMQHELVPAMRVTPPMHNNMSGSTMLAIHELMRGSSKQKPTTRLLSECHRSLARGLEILHGFVIQAAHLHAVTCYGRARGAMAVKHGEWNDQRCARAALACYVAQQRPAASGATTTTMTSTTTTHL